MRLVDELRLRMSDELDYRIEARTSVRVRARRTPDHPFIAVPAVVPERSTQRVLTTEWVDGLAWADFLATADRPARQRAGEILFRFAQGSIHRHRRVQRRPASGQLPLPCPTAR